MTTAGAAVVNGSTVVDPAASYRRSCTTARTPSPTRRTSRPEPVSRRTTRPWDRDPSRARPTRSVVPTMTTVARTAIGTTATHNGADVSADRTPSSPSSRPAVRATVADSSGARSTAPTVPSSTTSAASARASSPSWRVEAPRVRMRRVSDSRSDDSSAAATTRDAVPSTTRRTVGVRSDTRTRSLTSAGAVEQVGERRRDVGVPQGRAHPRRPPGRAEPSASMPAVRRRPSSTPPPGRLNGGLAPRSSRRRRRSHRQVTVDGPSEPRVERPGGDDERSVGREVRGGDAREPERVVDPQPLVDVGSAGTCP